MSDKSKILYVDDEPINLQLFEMNFGQKYDVLLAESGHSGMRLLDDHQDTSVVISDMKMPEMNGLEFIKEAKAKYPNKNYLILTGFDITDELKDALRVGLIMKFLQKPFNIDQIEHEIEKYINWLYCDLTFLC